MFLILFALELGLYSVADVTVYTPDRYLDEPTWYTQMETEVRVADIIGIGGSIKVSEYAMWSGFFPVDADSIVWVRLYLGPFTVGWEHRCVHPIAPWGEIPELRVEGGYERIYIRMESGKYPRTQHP